MNIRNQTVLVLTTLLASSAFASPQITHLFEPNTSKEFGVLRTVSTPLNLKDTNGGEVVLSKNGQLASSAVNVSALSSVDQADLQANVLQVNYDDKLKTSYVDIKNKKSDSTPQEVARFYLPGKVSIDGNMLIKNFTNMTSTADQSQQGVAVALTLNSGAVQHVDNNYSQSCTYTVTTQTGQDCETTVTQKDDGKGNKHEERNTVCTPTYTTTNYPGNQTCEDLGDIWSDQYVFSIEQAASFTFQQDYNTVGTNCTPCQ